MAYATLLRALVSFGNVNFEEQPAMVCLIPSPCVVLGDYRTVARELFDKELISETHYYSLLIDLGMNVDEIDALKSGEAE